MEIGALLVVAGLALAAAAFIARPLIDRQAREPAEAERRLSALRAEQDQVLALLQELDMDFAMGKIEPAAYQADRAERLRRGAELLREIDGLAGAAPTRRPVGPPVGDDLERRVAQLRSQAAGFCGQCGSPLAVGDKFCPRCGHPSLGSAA